MLVSISYLLAELLRTGAGALELSLIGAVLLLAYLPLLKLFCDLLLGFFEEVEFFL